MGIVQSRDELEYLLQHIGYYIGDLVDCVLEDSFEDPEYSAVTANNLIICFLRVQKMLGCLNSISTVKEYFLCSNYSEVDYQEFERRRNIEKAYYVGKQYTEDVEDRNRPTALRPKTP